jgi:hypothetical protein
MTQEDWNQLYQSIAMQLQRGNSNAGPGGEQAPPGEGGEEAPQEPTDINKDPQFRQMVDKAVAQGIPKGKAEAMIRDKLAQSENTPQ